MIGLAMATAAHADVTALENAETAGSTLTVAESVDGAAVVPAPYEALLEPGDPLRITISRPYRAVTRVCPCFTSSMVDPAEVPA